MLVVAVCVYFHAMDAMDALSLRERRHGVVLRSPGPGPWKGVRLEGYALVVVKKVLISVGGGRLKVDDPFPHFLVTLLMPML
jgi:hypothetical protein